MNAYQIAYRRLQEAIRKRSLDALESGDLKTCEMLQDLRLEALTIAAQAVQESLETPEGE